MRLGCLLPLIAIALIIGGGQSAYTGLKNRKVTEIAIDKLISSKPKEDWLNISGGVLDTLNSVYPTGRFGAKKATSLYVPLVPPGTDSSKSQIHVLVLTKDPGLLDFTNQMQQMENSNVNETDATAFLIRNADRLHIKRPVMGLAQFGIEANDKKTRKVRELYSNLADDVIILEEGKKPDTFLGLGMLIGGLIMAGLLVKSWLRPAPAATTQAPPPLPPQA